MAVGSLLAGRAGSECPRPSSAIEVAHEVRWVAGPRYFMIGGAIARRHLKVPMGMYNLKRPDQKPDSPLSRPLHRLPSKTCGSSLSIGLSGLPLMSGRNQTSVPVEEVRAGKGGRGGRQHLSDKQARLRLL